MTPVKRIVMQAYDAPTRVHKARAMEAALDALEAAVGTPKDSLLKAAGGTSTMCAEMANLSAQIANIQELDRLRAGRGQRKPQR